MRRSIGWALAGTLLAALGQIVLRSVTSDGRGSAATARAGIITCAMRPRLVPMGEARTSADGCRRYRPLGLTFDTRNVVLDTVIDDDWEPGVRSQWAANQAAVRAGLLAELGTANAEAKVENYRAMGSAPWSIVFEHSRLLAQVRLAFAHGDFYPALVGACALAERILVQLILVLRQDFQNDPATTKRVRRGGPFHEWGASIDVLHGWAVLSDELANTYRRLEDQRHAAVHFDPRLTVGGREPALRALLLLQEIVGGLFSPIGGPPRFIAGTPGAAFLSLEAEQTPVVRRVFLPQCVLVSPAHLMCPAESIATGWQVVDDADYGPDLLTDEAFASALPAAVALMQQAIAPDQETSA